MNLALIGAGQRGMIYAQHACCDTEHKLVAVADTDPAKRNAAKDKFHVDPALVFESADAFFAAGKIADAVIIATMDQDHYGQTMKALELGYDILLEKPISPNPAECLAIRRTAHEHGCQVVVCHVLRYTNFFAAIKQILDSGELGKVVTIQHAENVGNFHMAHSFVRGNWRNSKQTSPIIMQKSCHDMDILVWLADSNAKRISSFGDRSFFREENAPAGSADRCLDCPKAGECRFDVHKAYLPLAGEWPATVVCEEQTEAALLEAFKTSPYGRCVFRCDNDVCDHQVTLIEFENGVTATFHLSGLTNKMHRTIRIMCEHGEICGDDHDNTLTITHYSANAQYEGESRTIHVESAQGFHGGGDWGLTMDFLAGAQNNHKDSKSSVDRSIESHLMAHAAELSRVTGKVIDLAQLKQELSAEGK